MSNGWHQEQPYYYENQSFPVSPMDKVMLVAGSIGAKTAAPNGGTSTFFGKLGPKKPSTREIEMTDMKKPSGGGSPKVSPHTQGDAPSKHGVLKLQSGHGSRERRLSKPGSCMEGPGSVVQGEAQPY